MAGANRGTGYQTRIPNMAAIRAALLADPAFRIAMTEPLFVIDAAGNFVVDGSGSYLTLPMS